MVEIIGVFDMIDAIGVFGMIEASGVSGMIEAFGIFGVGVAEPAASMRGMDSLTFFG
jgi:hypothetical protein